MQTGRFRRLASILVLVAWLLPPASGQADDMGAGTVDLGGAAEAEEPVPEAPSSSIGEKVFDALILRPTGALATVGGMVFYVISVPLVAPSKNLSVTWDIFVLGPYDYTVERPLGEF